MLSRYGYKNATEISRGAAMRKRSRMDVSAGNTDALYEQVDVPACISRTSRRARELRARYGELAGISGRQDLATSDEAGQQVISTTTRRQI